MLDVTKLLPAVVSSYCRGLVILMAK